MARFELKLPKMGESVAEATITNWLKKVIMESNRNWKKITDGKYLFLVGEKKIGEFSFGKTIKTKLGNVVVVFKSENEKSI